MLVVTIEYLPGGNKQKSQVIGVAEIVNRGSPEGDASMFGNYDITLFHSQPGAARAHIFKKGEVLKHPRKKLGCWDLLFRALADTVGYRNGGSL